MPVGDDLLPRTVPRTLGPSYVAFVMAVLAGMAIAAIAGGINWLIGVGGAGTALGTLGLAYFTFTMAERTTELAASSQRLEAAANKELIAGRDQASAAAATALEAQKSRIDAVAPIVDLDVQFSEGKGRTTGLTPAADFALPAAPGQARDLNHISLSAVLVLRFQNFGRTPGFATTKYVGAAFTEQQDVIRVDQSGQRLFIATLDYGPSHDPFAPREIRYVIEVNGAMNRGTVDTITWRGELTLLERDIQGWHLHPDPLRPIDYQVVRTHGES